MFREFTKRSKRGKGNIIRFCCGFITSQFAANNSPTICSAKAHRSRSTNDEHKSPTNTWMYFFIFCFLVSLLSRQSTILLVRKLVSLLLFSLPSFVCQPLWLSAILLVFHLACLLPCLSASLSFNQIFSQSYHSLSISFVCFLDRNLTTYFTENYSRPPSRRCHQIYIIA